MTEPSSTPKQVLQSSARPHRGNRKWMLVILLLSMIGGILALPRIVSSRWLYEPLLKRLAVEDFSLSVDRIRFGWFEKIALEGVRITEKDMSPILQLQSVELDQSLLSVLLSFGRISAVKLDQLVVNIDSQFDQSSMKRLANAVQAKWKLGNDPVEAPKAKSEQDIRVLISGMKIHFLDSAQERLDAKELERERNLMDDEAVKPLITIAPTDLHLRYLSKNEKTSLQIEPVVLLDNVQLSPELMRLGLGYAVPLLNKSAWFDGRISLKTGALDINLDQPYLSRGEGVIQLHQVRTGPSDPNILRLIAFLATTVGREAVGELVFVDSSDVAIKMADGRVQHEGLKLGLPKVDERLQVETSGVVTIEDRSLRMQLEIPVPLAQLALREKVRELGVPKVTVPVEGTLDQPTVDWAALRSDSSSIIASIRAQLGEDALANGALLEVLEGVAGGSADQAIGATVDFIGELRKRRQERIQQQSPLNNPTEADPNKDGEPINPPPASNRPFRDALRGILRGSNNSQ